MKTKFLLFATVLMIVFGFTEFAESKIIGISSSNFQFTPSVVSAAVGDTIRWTNISGSHTTTCNGTNGTIRPSGAAPWNANLNSGSPTFSYVVTVPGKYIYVCLPHAPDMQGVINVSTTSVNTINELADAFEISQNYPNPFNPSTKIKFAIPSSETVTIKIFDEVGREVTELVSSHFQAGTYEAEWNASEMSSGVYYYRITAGEFVQTRKMLLIK